jgi:hypothetical protein
MEKHSLFSPLVILRLFAAVFVTLVGLGFMLKAALVGPLFYLGAFFAAIGLTFFVVLWLGSKTA